MGSNSDNSKFDLQLNLGVTCEKSGDINKSLEHYKNAYDIATALENKKYQVDALVKIIEAYFHKGEIEVSIKYAQSAEELLRDIDYVKGQLDINLFLLKVYYIKNQYYKAREIGNESLKLCTEEHIVYKGRILNILANLHRDLTSVDEHLDLLQQSLVCFQKVNELRGILGVLNNIGVVYAEKLQDNEKALEYFFKLKEQSEDSNYAEFHVFAHFNIGEAYFKCLRYNEALYWCKLALEKAEKAHMEAMVFHAYIILISIYIKLNNYSEAYAYFNLANKELEQYPDQGERLPWYHKSVASLFLEFGESHKANDNIKQGLEILGNEESIIKWDTGIIYELIKLKESKNKTDILTALEGIAYLLSKFKSMEVRVSLSYDIALELIELGQVELAFKLVGKYKDIKTENRDITLKIKYIEALRNNNEAKVQSFNSALALAVELENHKLQLKVYSSLAEYYFEMSDYEKSFVYCMNACKQVKNIVGNIPEEFKLPFVNSNNLFKPYNRLVQVRQYYYSTSANDDKQRHTIGNGDELIEFFKELDKVLI